MNEPFPLDVVLRTIVYPALGFLPLKSNTPKARVELLAIGQQESKFKDRFQVLNDPTKKGAARGFWQFEEGGGVKGVLAHEASCGWAHIVCAAREVAPERRPVWLALEKDDILACVFARLLLLTDPKPLPEIGDEAGAWAYYLRNWRPGKPHPKEWPANYRRAVEAVMNEEA